MRSIATHQINECNSAIRIEAEDTLGPGGAPHRYEVSFGRQPRPENQRTVVTLDFQNGAIAEVGTNGITHEALLAVLIDRLEHFQAGPYACEENETALLSLYNARGALNARTGRRVAAGMEGTMQTDEAPPLRGERKNAILIDEFAAFPSAPQTDAPIPRSFPPLAGPGPHAQAVELTPEQVDALHGAPKEDFDLRDQNSVGL